VGEAKEGRPDNGCERTGMRLGVVGALSTGMDVVGEILRLLDGEESIVVVEDFLYLVHS
jgi:NADPH-dependent glutamate synthase beta subunit-like oxidoreductase